MKTCLLSTSAALAALFCTASQPLQAKINRDVDKVFTVAPGGVLAVGTQGGYIHVETGADNQVHVIAHEHIRAGSEEEADRLLKELELTIAADKDGVTATSRYARDDSDHFGSWPPVQVDFVVTVPKRYSARLHTAGGDIRVADLDGTLESHTAGGNIEIGRISGAVEAHTSGGNIIAESVGGKLDARTSGGNIRATFSQPLKENCSLSTSGGNVRVAVPAGSGYELDAATSGGSVDADGITLTITRGGVGKSRLAGKVGGGGPLLRLRTSGGNVTLKNG